MSANMTCPTCASTCTRSWKQRALRSGALPRRLTTLRPRAVEELVEPSSSSSGGGGGGSDSGSADLQPSDLQLHATNAAAVQQAGKRVAVLQATKFAAVPVQEGERPLAEYMTLPASQYSVLDAKRIERLDEETFVCYVGGLKFFSFEVEPVITVSVTVQERGPTVRLLGAKLRGSKSVEAANDKFSATMTNVVRWREAPHAAEGNGSGNSGDKEICSETSLQVVLDVPSWFIMPVAAIEKTGCTVMETVLNTAVPRFLKQLAADYALWARGNEAQRASAAVLSSDSWSEGED